MKKNLFFILAVLIFTGATAATDPVKKLNINTQKSSVKWVGKKVTGSHNGTINIKEGHLDFENQTLVGGKIVVDMTTINVSDLKSGEGKEGLEKHLNSEDFFNSLQFTTATFEIKETAKSGTGYSVMGALTIKGITEMIKVNMTATPTGATAKVNIDRTKFNIRYGSTSFFDNLKNKAINDNFELDINIQF